MTKKYLLILFIMLLTTQATIAQKDTLKYIQDSFVNQKEKYVGKPFKVMIDDLKIPIKSFVQGFNRKKIATIDNIFFSFYPYEKMITMISNKQKPLLVYVIWKEPISLLINHGASKLKNSGNWTDDEKGFYESQIVGDIFISNSGK